jgi:thiol-disulfide isomerase/thioredoxin
MRAAFLMAVTALYTATAPFANPAMADMTAARAAAQTGDMRKLVFHDAPQPVPPVELLTLDDQPRSLTEWQGQWVVVNFWATWCAPCREEMPTLDRLAADGIPVVAVATGRNPPAVITRFWNEVQIRNLPALRDPKGDLGRGMGILGLPVTVILNPEGLEIARLIGDARWDSTEARAVMAALAAP